MREGGHIYPIILNLLQDLNLRQYQFSVLQDVPLAGVVVEISAIL